MMTGKDKWLDQRVAVIPHADYMMDEKTRKEILKPEGIDQVIKTTIGIAEEIGCRYFEPGRMLIITSLAPRARATAEIMHEMLGGSILPHIALGNENGSTYFEQQIVDELELFLDPVSGYQLLIFVTHGGTAESLPAYLIDRGSVQEGIPRGTACILDIENRSVVRVG